MKYNEYVEVCDKALEKGNKLGPLPSTNFQVLKKRFECQRHVNIGSFAPGLGKDLVEDRYKVVWLWNSSDLNFEDVTTCEVFDFRQNAWRHVCLASPYPIFYVDPAYVEGTLYWLADWTTKDEVINIVTFDLQREKFDVIRQLPFNGWHKNNVDLCNANKRLCASVLKSGTYFVWFFNKDEKNWLKFFKINVEDHFQENDIMFMSDSAITPLALLNGEILFLDSRSDMT